MRGVLRVAVRADVKVVLGRKVIVMVAKKSLQVDFNTTESVVHLNVVVARLGFKGVLRVELQTQ